MKRINIREICLRRIVRAVTMAVFAAVLVLATFARPALADDDDDDELVIKPPPATALDPRAFEARFNDDSRLKLTLAEDRIEITSRYGQLPIAVSDIRRIEFALRLPDATKKQIEDAIAELGSSDSPNRSEAAGRLVALGNLAYPALVKAAQDNSPAGKRAAELLAKLKESVDEKEFAPRDVDVIQTVDSTISGQIVTPVLRVRTEQFGDLSLKIADARSLTSPALAEKKAESDDRDALPDPGNLYNYPDHSHKTLKFRVTGSAEGFIWGTDIYTADSQLATAAVHAGLLKPGQTRVVKVKLMPPPPAFTGSARNGIESRDFGPFPEAYRFVK